MNLNKNIFRMPRENLFKTVEKSWKIKSFGHSRAPKNATFWTFSLSWGNWPIYIVIYVQYKKMKFLQVWEIKNYGNNNFFWHLCSSYGQFIGEHFRSTRLRQVLAKFPGFVNLLSVWRLLAANVCQTPSKASPINAHCLYFIGLGTTRS